MASNMSAWEFATNIVVLGTPLALVLVAMLVKMAKEMPPNSQDRKDYISAANDRLKNYVKGNDNSQR